MAGEINFILTLVFLGIMAYVCMKRCSPESSNYLPGTTKLLSYLGMGFIIIGMALYYTFGIYGFEYAAPFLIIGMIITIVGSCKARSDQNAIPSETPQKSSTTGISNNDHENINQIAEVARGKGLLVERPHPDKPNVYLIQIRCPICRYLFDLGTSKIIESTVYCPSCYKGTDLSQ